MGGEVIIQGKPEKDIYIEATKSIKLDKSKTVAVGDSIFHDIKGANNFSIDSILVKSGIHKDLETIKMLCKNHQIEPTYLIEDFSL
jgi:Predicted sugar phosphatases of the HAD superfamily